MLTSEELDDLRDDLDSELLDTVKIERETGTTLDDDPNSPTYMQEITTYTTLSTSDALVVLDQQTARVHTDVGDQAVVTSIYVVTVPVTLVDVRPGDRVTVVESHDARMEGRVLWVRDPRVGSLSISRRLICQDTLPDN